MNARVRMISGEPTLSAAAFRARERRAIRWELEAALSMATTAKGLAKGPLEHPLTAAVMKLVAINTKLLERIEKLEGGR